MVGETGTCKRYAPRILRLVGFPLIDPTIDWSWLIRRINRRYPRAIFYWSSGGSLGHTVGQGRLTLTMGPILSEMRESCGKWSRSSTRKKGQSDSWRRRSSNVVHNPPIGPMSRWYAQPESMHWSRRTSPGGIRRKISSGLYFSGLLDY